ncbi:MAG: DNA-directed RNA polymerase subunit B'', partial [Candidatus Bathyarchaeota archaeon]
MVISQDDLLTLQKSFFKEKGLVRQHLDSYNKFIDSGLQEVIDEIGEINIEIPEMPYKIKLGQLWVIDPQSKISRPYRTEVDGTKHEIFPMEARFRNLTYSAPLALEMTPVIEGREQEPELVLIGDLPVMLKSKLCILSQLTSEELVEYGEDPHDQGGYFLINGSERVVVAMEDLAPNRILVDIDTRGTKPVYQAKIFSTTVGFRARIQLRLKTDSGVFVSIPGVPTEVPFMILMRALGIDSDKEIAETVSPNPQVQNELETSFEKAAGFDTVKDALMYIGNRVAHGQVEEYRNQKAKSIIDRNFLPHIGRTEESRITKALFLGEMA